MQSQSYGLVTGRVSALALDPGDATNNTLYVGTAGGGVWKSTNAASGSITFTALTDTLPVFSPNAGTAVIPSLSIGAVAVQPGGTGVVLAGTGDPNDAADSYYGEGVLRSTDGGQTWSLVQSANGGSFVGEGISGFAWSTASPSLVVMAVSSAAEAAAVGASKNPGVRGLYYSTNAGATWTLATIQDGSTVLQNRTTSYASFRGNAVTSVVWNPVRQMFYAAVRSHGYYQSSDGITWTRMANQPGTGLTTGNCQARPGDYGLLSCPIFRGTLAVQPVTGDLFAVTVDSSNGTQGLWQDVCASNGSACASSTPVWATKIDLSPVTANGIIDAGDYNLALAAVPAATALSSQDTLLFLGTADLYRCNLAGGCSFRNTTNATTGCAAPAGVAPAHHALAWGLNLANAATPTLFLGSDGGLWRSLDGVRQQAAVCSADDRTHFDNLNGSLGSLAEVVSLSSHPSDSSVMLAALGANGAAASTSATQASSSAPWVQLTAAESGAVSIDQGSGTTWLVQSGSGVALHTCTNGTQCTAADFSGPAVIGSAQTSGDAASLDPPALLDPALNTNVLLGTCRVWRGPVSSGASWSSANAISAPMLGLLSGGACTSGNATIRSLAAGGALQMNSNAQNSGSPVLYAGLSGAATGGAAAAGHLYRTTAAGVAGASTPWTDLTTNTVTNDPGSRFNAGGFDISSIAVDHSDPSGMTVYATVQGFGYPHVYRSINGGSTWLNISANLPNAPANAVAVDPNNPRVVYVAMDTGVYVATDVTTCVSAVTGATGACWSVYGSSLPNAPVTALSLAAGATLPGSSQAGILRAATYGRGVWQIPLYTAGQTSSAAIGLAPGSLSFGGQSVGTTSAAQTVTVTNTGTAALQVTGVQPGSGFLTTDTCSGVSVAVGATCSIAVRFAPVTAGPVTASVQIFANVAGGYTALAMTGTATGVARLSSSPISIAFGDVAVNASSAPQAATITNTGSAAATLQTVAVSSGYNILINGCAGTLAPGASCTVTVAFAPTSAGPNNGTLTVGSSAGPATVQLSANAVGRANLVYSRQSIAFSGGYVDTVASGVVYTFTNSGTVAGSISTPVLTGDFFYLQDTCPAVVFPNANCSVLVFFVPTAVGQRTGTMTFTDDAGAHVITLSGTAFLSAALQLPSDLTFPDTNVNSVSAPLQLTLTNTGSTASFGIPQVAGDFAVRSTTCGTGLLQNASCALQVIFDPLGEGQRDGFVQVTFGGASYVTRLHGHAIGHGATTAAPAAVIFGAVGIGSRSQPQTVALTNTGTGSVTLQSQTVSPSDFQVVASTCGASLAAGTTCTLTLAFAPSSGGARSGTLTLVDNTATHAIPLSGTGSGHASVSVTPATIDFGVVPLGQSAQQDATVSNTGDADIGLLPPAATGDFSVTGTTCGTRIAPGATCTVTVRFTPSADGGRTGSLSVADTAAAHTVVLTGAGQGSGSLLFSPLALVFGNTPVGAASSTQTVKLTNAGTATAVLQPPSVDGDFRVSATTCGSTLPAGSICTFDVAFTPHTAGFRSGALSVADAGGTHSVALSGTGTAGVLTMSSSSISFDDTALNSSSAARTVVLTNTGNTALFLGTITVVDDFASSANCSGVSLAAGAACTLSLTFTPRSAGPHRGTLTVPITGGGTAGASTVSLSGNGKSAFNLTLTPGSVDFGTETVGSSSAVVNVTVSNTGTVVGGLGAIAVSGADFSLRANTCGTTLAPQTGCTVSLVFTPSVAGARTGTLSIASDAGSQTVALTGRGQSSATDALSAVALTFAPQTVGSTSATQTLTLTNSGDVPLTLLSAQVLSGDFTAVNACGPTLPAHTSCSLAVAFAPRSVGAASGVLQVTDVQRSQTVALNGTGVAAAGQSLTPASVSFAATGVGSAGAGQTLTFSNAGARPVTLASIAVGGNFGLLAGTGSCASGAVVPAGGSCTLVVAFLPQAAGLLDGSVTVTDTAGGTHTSQLQGTGIDFSLAANGSTTATLSSGGTATYPLLLRPAVNTADAVTFACAGAPAYTRCTVVSQYSDLSATGTVSVTLLTGTASTKAIHGVALLSLLLMPFCGSRRMRRGAGMLLLCCAVFAMGGCGSNKATALSGTGSGSGSGSTVTTPAGTYTITVSATAAGVTHTVPLTLTVQ